MSYLYDDYDPENDKLEVSIERYDQAAVLRAVGDVSTRTSLTLERELMYRLDDPEVSKIILSLEGVGFMDSSGLKTVADAHRLSLHADKTFEVHDPPQGIRKLFTVTGMDQYITIVPVPSEEE